MANIYGGNSKRSTYKPKANIAPSGGGGASISDGLDAGKGSIDLLDFGGSVAETAGSYAQTASGYVGGAAGAVGQIGFGDGKNLGAIADVPGNVLGAIGGIGLPYLGNDPTKQAATVGDIPGMALDVVSAPGKAVERTIAGQRVEGGPLKDFDVMSILPGGGILSALNRVKDSAEGKDSRDIPADLQARLDAGESVDVIADELVSRGAGYSNDPLVNLAGQIVLDPLNLIAPGASKVGQSIKQAGRAVAATESIEDFAKLGLSTRAAGVAYNTAARGMSAGGAIFLDRAVGKATSGALFALGTKPFRAISEGLRGIDQTAARTLDDSFSVANGNLTNAVIVDIIASDDAVGAGNKFLGLEEQIAERLKTIDPKLLARRAQEKLESTADLFLGKTNDELAEISAGHLSITADISIEDARRVIASSKADPVKLAQTTHWARYGRAVDDFGSARARALAEAGADAGIDIDRLTLIAEDTLTMERAQNLAKLAEDAPETLYDEAMKFSVISNHFLGKTPTHGQILEFMGKLAKEKALPSAVRMPKTGKNPLPGALSEWRQKWGQNGYDLGFAPENRVKTLTDADGKVVWSKPWVDVTTRHDPVTVRNGLGRAVDGMRRGITQTTIVQQSRTRLVRVINGSDIGISPNQSRNIHKAIIDEAASRSLTPRALVAEREGGESVIHAIFKRHLTDAEYNALTEKVDPTYLVMHAFEGNLNTVGVTQKLSGRAKSVDRTHTIAKVADAIYPKMRFTYRPTFQLQEMIESPFLNALRGIGARQMDDDVLAAYRQLAEQPQFKYLTEASYLNIAGDRLMTRFVGKNTPVGRAMGRFANIQARKHQARVTQTLAEHGEEFKSSVQAINPRAWSLMEEAYGTTDARVIADNFLKERLGIGANENIDEAMRLLDEAASDEAVRAVQGTLNGFDEAIAPGQEAASQAANVRAGVARGGTVESGGAMKPNAPKPSWAHTPEGETVWQVFRDSFERVSTKAFQTHFFNPQRGWLERSLNHPYLGIYPLSYMWGKILPEFARFLIARPFGLKAPLTGFAATTRVQQAFLGALQDDPEFQQFMEDHAEAIYFAQLLLPGDPTNLTAHLPAPVRHIGEDLAAGKDVNLETIGREVADAGTYALAGPVKDIAQFGNILTESLPQAQEDIFSMLERAAREYDGQFGSP